MFKTERAGGHQGVDGNLPVDMVSHERHRITNGERLAHQLAG